MSLFKKNVVLLLLFQTVIFYSQQDSLLQTSSRILNVQSAAVLKKNNFEAFTGLILGKNNSADAIFKSNFISDINVDLAYGWLNKLTIGATIDNVNNLTNGYVKWRIFNHIKQLPVSMSFYGNMGYTFKNTQKLYAGIIKDFSTNEAHRLNYCSQLIICGVVKKKFLIQIMPCYIYRNFIKENYNLNNLSEDANGFFSVGFAGKIKLSHHLWFAANYFYNLPKFYKNNNLLFNPVTVGLEYNKHKNNIGFFISNSSSLAINNFITQTGKALKNGQVNFGITLSRLFSF